jgi:hypothetical protein
MVKITRKFFMNKPYIGRKYLKKRSYTKNDRKYTNVDF